MLQILLSNSETYGAPLAGKKANGAIAAPFRFLMARGGIEPTI